MFIGLLILFSIIIVLASFSANMALIFASIGSIALLTRNRTAELLGLYFALAPFGWFENLLNSSFMGLPFGVILSLLVSLSILGEGVRRKHVVRGLADNFVRWIIGLIVLYIVAEIATKFRYIYLGWEIFDSHTFTVLNGLSQSIKELIRILPVYLLLVIYIPHRIVITLEKYFISGIILLICSIYLTSTLNSILTFDGELIGMESRSSERVYGLFALKGDGNTAAICLSLSLFYFKVLIRSNVSRIMFYLFCGLAIYYTGSRTGILLFLAMLVLNSLNFYSKKGVAFIIFMIVAFLLMNSGYLNLGRLNNIGDEFSSNVSGSRVFIWSQYYYKWSNSFDSLLLGSSELPRFDRFFFVPHNLWLLIIFNWGAIGGGYLLLKVWPIGDFFGQVYKEYGISLRLLFFGAFLGLFTVADSGALFFLILIVTLLLKRIDIYEDTSLV